MSGDQAIGVALIVVPGICYLLAILFSSTAATKSAAPTRRAAGEFEQLLGQVDAARADFTGDDFSLWDAELTDQRRSEP